MGTGGGVSFLLVCYETPHSYSCTAFGFPAIFVLLQLLIRSVFKNESAAWGKVVVLSPGSHGASALWPGHCGLAQDPCALLLPLGCRACLSASFCEKALVFISTS